MESPRLKCNECGEALQVRTPGTPEQAHLGTWWVCSNPKHTGAVLVPHPSAALGKATGQD